jgi:hypothetical protein
MQLRIVLKISQFVHHGDAGTFPGSPMGIVTDSGRQ